MIVTASKHADMQHMLTVPVLQWQPSTCSTTNGEYLYKSGSNVVLSITFALVKD